MFEDLKKEIQKGTNLEKENNQETEEIQFCKKRKLNNCMSVY